MIKTLRMRKFNIRQYELTFRVYYFCFFLSMAPYVIEAYLHYDGVPDRFLGNFYFAPFWIGWGSIALISCIIAFFVDSIRAQGMCISLSGTWYMFRILQNLVDGADPERLHRSAVWLAFLLICFVVSYNLSRTRPNIKYMAQVQRERELKDELAKWEAQDRAKAEESA